jgi:hypothetical protein
MKGNPAVSVSPFFIAHNETGRLPTPPPFRGLLRGWWGQRCVTRRVRGHNGNAQFRYTHGRRVLGVQLSGCALHPTPPSALSVTARSLPMFCGLFRKTRIGKSSPQNIGKVMLDDSSLIKEKMRGKEKYAALDLLGAVGQNRGTGACLKRSHSVALNERCNKNRGC